MCKKNCNVRLLLLLLRDFKYDVIQIVATSNHCSFVRQLERKEEALSTMEDGEGFYILLWVLALIVTSVLIFFSVHLLVNLIDLASDYLNPIDMCQTVNKCVLPEYITHSFLIFLFLVGGYWFEVLFNLPLLAWNVQKYLNHKHLLDPTRIYDDLEKKKKNAFYVIGFEVVSFFWYLYRFVHGLVTEF